MTLEEFCTISRQRILTPTEFLSFVESMRWKIKVSPDGKAALSASKDDPVALALARMLGREPYRSNVLSEVQRRWRAQHKPCREWLWPTGHRFTETPDNEWLYGYADRHPTGAWWWRWQGEIAWQEIAGRARGPLPQGELSHDFVRRIPGAIPGQDAGVLDGRVEHQEVRTIGAGVAG